VHGGELSEGGVAFPFGGQPSDGTDVPSSMLVAVISDTHLPKGDRRLPELCLKLIAGADAVIHAGDIATVHALRGIQAIGPKVYAVHGNVDEQPLRRQLPASRRIQLAGRSVGVTHDAGPARGRLERLKARFPDAQAVVFGHTHLPQYECCGGFQIFNPGSPTERRRAPRRAMGLMYVDVDLERVSFEHVWLEPR
jgi:putative phosphoesterase